MKTSIALLLTALTWTAVVLAEDGLSLEGAKAILELSLNKRDRINALCTLRNGEERAESAAGILGRIVAISPTGDEAGYAAEALGRIGRPSIPIVATLVPNGFDWSYVCATRTIARLPRELESELVAALEPTLSLPSNSDRFNGILALRWFNLSPECANQLARRQMEHRGTSLAAALFLAPKGNDASLLAAIERVEREPLMCVKYLGERIREEWRRRDSPIRRLYRSAHARPPLPKDEQDRSAAADAKLAQLAANAIPEVLTKLRLGPADDTHNKYLWMAMLGALSEHSKLPRVETVEALDKVGRQRGGLIDRLLIEFRDKISKTSEQSDAADSR
jgi:hypothetical protein